MTFDEMRIVLLDIECGEYGFSIHQNKGVNYLVARYMEPDCYTKKMELQTTRKWMLSEHMTKSELVQTALKCVLASMEHRGREKFCYRGQRIFGPHFDVDALHDLCTGHELDVRPTPTLT